MDHRLTAPLVRSSTGAEGSVAGHLAGQSPRGDSRQTEPTSTPSGMQLRLNCLREETAEERLQRAEDERRITVAERDLGQGVDSCAERKCIAQQATEEEIVQIVRADWSLRSSVPSRLRWSAGAAPGDTLAHPQISSKVSASAVRFLVRAVPARSFPPCSGRASSGWRRSRHTPTYDRRRTCTSPASASSPRSPVPRTIASCWLARSIRIWVRSPLAARLHR